MLVRKSFVTAGFSIAETPIVVLPVFSRKCSTWEKPDSV